MATFRKRGTSWRCEVSKNGIRKSGTFDTKGQARDWAARIEAEITQGRHGGVSASLGEAFKRYSDQVSPTKKGGRWERIRLNLLQGYPLASVQMRKLDASHIAEWRDKRLTEVAPSSVNRELNLISAVLTRAMKEWKWIGHNPVTEIERPKNPKPRFRRISDAEIDQYLFCLDYHGGAPVSSSQQVAVIFLVALETAMRLGEIVGLMNADVSDRYVILRDTKNDDRREVPLSTEARRLIGLVWRKERPQERLFSVSGAVVSTLSRRAVKAAGIDDLRFHDTRHEALTRLARKLDVLDLAKMIGHRDPKSLMIYYNPTAEEIADRLG